MKDKYDFSNAKRGAVLPQKNKTRITIYIDNTILDEFRDRADQEGRGYQTMINDALREHSQKPSEQLTEHVLRKVIREELLRDKQDSIINYPSTATSSNWSANTTDMSTNNAKNGIIDFNKTPMTGH